jgi:hypothetical protein
MISERDIFFFDLQGYLVIKGALTAQEVAGLNTCIDAIPALAPGEWYGYIHHHTYGTNDGINYQQIYEAGEPFEKLIDHPSWFERVKYFVGGEGSFDWTHGPVFIDENFVNLRTAGQAIGLHNGGHLGIHRCQFRVKNGKFHCGQINIIVALNDIGPGDGGTMLIPGSHKSNFAHPDYAQFSMREGASVDNMEGAKEMHLKAGDALLFVDCVSHGSAKRVNPGQRRVCIYRYGPSWGNFRHGYQPSPELLARLTPQRRQIVSPQRPMPRTPNRLPVG